MFTTPALEAGKVYYYNVSATVTRDGKEQSINQRVKVRGGEETHVNLEIPAATLAAR